MDAVVIFSTVFRITRYCPWEYKILQRSRKKKKQSARGASGQHNNKKHSRKSTPVILRIYWSGCTVRTCKKTMEC
jgi:hypothetical protein